MDELTEQRFLDLVSEAAIDSSLWAPVLERLADHLGGGGAFISRLNAQTGIGAIETVRLDPEVLKNYQEYYYKINAIAIVEDTNDYLRQWKLSITTDEDSLPKEDLVHTEYYNDFMKPTDTHSCLMIRLGITDLDVSAITITRSEARGRFADQDTALARRLQPHLVRACANARKLAEVEPVSGSFAASLSRSRHGVFLVGSDGRVKFANAVAEQLAAGDGGLRVIGGRLTAVSPHDARRLHQLIGHAGAPRFDGRTGGVMGLATPLRRLPLSISVTAMAPSQISVFSGQASVMVLVTDLEAEPRLRETALRELFDLSHAEARVAIAFAGGQDAKEVAESLGISFFTVRGHLVRIYEKTQTNRQSELVRLLTRMDNGDPFGN